MLTFTIPVLWMSVLLTQETEQTWHSDYGKALAEAKQDGRPLLVVIEKSDTPAKKFDETKLSKAAGAKIVLANYKLCRVDASTDYGKKVADAFKATEFPHASIIDKTGKVQLFKKSGDMQPAQWNETLDKHRNGIFRRVVAAWRASKPCPT